ncbi:hypothetical protein ML462_13520 [Gramella lutea]|uniref:Uncharacterized protein n=1 Tax=Christiangramia lutea TaxID=1607951 RepID=A0A9X1V490_9FLAO|nr:hypothetical protein [Christiangramia lutea]MCH4824192.1 hypothetical protein [Christiangramia lutea]
MMVSSKLKNVFHSKKIRKTLKKREFPSERNSGRIGLIIDSGDLDSANFIFEIYKDLEIEKGDFRIVICGEVNPEIGEIDADVLRPDGISISGNFKSERIRDFAGTHFDLLICFFGKKNLAGILLAAETMATKKFGNKPDEFGVFDVEISAINIAEFQQEVIKYFRIFKR